MNIGGKKCEREYETIILQGDFNKFIQFVVWGNTLRVIFGKSGTYGILLQTRQKK